MRWTSAAQSMMQAVMYGNLIQFGSRGIGKTRFAPGFKTVPGTKTWRHPIAANVVGVNYLVQAQAAASSMSSIAAAMQQLSITVKAIPAALQQFLQAVGKGVEEEKGEQLVAPGSSPDIAGTVVGYRVWEVDEPQWEERTQMKLGSVAQPYYWDPGRNEAQLCPNNSKEEPHPYPWCMCGFWAMWDPVDVPYPPGLHHYDAEYVEVTTFGSTEVEKVLSRTGGWQGYILGKVEGWGIVVEAERGWRAQYAKIVELYYPPSPVGGEQYVHTLGVAYGVPVLESDFDFNYD